MSDVPFPQVVVTRPHDVECDSCGEHNACVLVAASNMKKLRLCIDCASLIAEGLMGTPMKQMLEIYRG